MLKQVSVHSCFNVMLGSIACSNSNYLRTFITAGGMCLVTVHAIVTAIMSITHTAAHVLGVCGASPVSPGRLVLSAFVGMSEISFTTHSILLC